ncbi:MAG: sn-glycerol-1-phosphate dehydrogenase [Muribaculaceae bacterium]|nr:sn-glycerol-1-phosphate dehydrogenase [Muribaculaceae bacterium]
MTIIEQALERATDTKSLLIAEEAIDGVATMFRNMFPNSRPIVIADSTTWQIAGARINSLLEEAGLKPDDAVILSDRDLHAEWKHIERLDNVLGATDAVAVAVGSGTINDLSKLSSHHCGKRYMNVSTAASMDGYTAYGASITKDGAKQTFSCPAPLAVLADISIIAQAPSEMTASGYADLFAKIPAGADWIISDALGVEPIDDFAWELVQGSLKSALANPSLIKAGDKKAIHRLIEGLIMSGFAMQAHQSSRPASGADHQFSHLWNMEHHTMADGTTPSHGFQVSIGTLMSTAMYEQLLKEDIGNLDVDTCVAAWPSLEEQLNASREMFRLTDFPTIGETELSAKYVNKDELRRQLTILKHDWPIIKARLEHQLIPFGEMRESLGLVGAPTEPEQIGISRRRLCSSAIKAQMIRRRFTILDVAVRTNCLDKWLGAMFGSEFKC